MWTQFCLSNSSPRIVSPFLGSSSSSRSEAAGFGRHGMPPPASNHLMTQAQHFVSRIKKRQRWNVHMMWAYDLDLWPWRWWRRWLMRVVVLHPCTKFEVRIGLAIRKIWRTMCVSINGPDNPDLWPCDLETGVRVASKVGNLPSKFGHARPLGSRIIRYVRGRTDRRTDKSNAYCPFPTGAGA